MGCDVIDGLLFWSLMCASSGGGVLLRAGEVSSKLSCMHGTSVSAPQKDKVLTVYDNL